MQWYKFHHRKYIVDKKSIIPRYRKKDTIIGSPDQVNLTQIWGENNSADFLSQKIIDAQGTEPLFCSDAQIQLESLNGKKDTILPFRQLKWL